MPETTGSTGATNFCVLTTFILSQDLPQTTAQCETESPFFQGGPGFVFRTLRRLNPNGTVTSAGYCVKCENAECTGTCGFGVRTKKAPNGELYDVPYCNCRGGNGGPNGENDPRPQGDGFVDDEPQDNPNPPGEPETPGDN